MTDAPVILKNTATDNPAAVYLARLAPGSRRTMKNALQVIAGILAEGEPDPLTFPWRDLGYSHVREVRSAVSVGYAPATANRILSALRGTLGEAWRLGEISAERFHRLRDIENIRFSRIPRGRVLDRKEISAVMRACRGFNPRGKRDLAIIAVLIGAGLRRAEVVALNPKDFDAEAGTISVQAGKGNRGRIVPLAAGAADHVAAWLDIRGTIPGALFPRFRQDAIALDKWEDPARMTPQAIWYIIDQRRQAAGIAPFTPHDLRRTFASGLLAAGVDLNTVKELLGHSSADTTAIYDHRGDKKKAAAARRFKVPGTYKPRRKKT